MDDLEGKVADEKFYECALGNDILAADLNGENLLLLDISVYRSLGIAHDLGRFVCGERVGKVPESLLHVRSERFLAVIRKSDIALCDGDGVHGLTVQQHLPLPGLALKIPTGISSHLAFLCFCR